MKTITEWNLDDSNEVAEFIDLYGTMKGRALANKLGASGKNAVKNANNLSAYAWNKKTSMLLRTAGNIGEAVKYEMICENIYGELPEDIRW
jgi:hypothetical protein